VSRMGVVALALAVLGTACSGDDDAQPSTTPPTSVAASTSTGPATTVAPTAPPSTTAAPTTTQSVDQLRTEVEAAFQDLNAKVAALLRDPSLDGVDARVAEIAVPGSPYADALIGRVTRLVNNNELVRPNFQSIEKLTIESVDIADPNRANVTACQVTNAMTFKRAEASPTPGRSIPIDNSGALFAARFTQSLVRTPAGWRHEGVADPSDPVWEGLDACPPA
jgi:hypothetical protein